MSRSSPDTVQWMLLGEMVSATEKQAMPRCLTKLQCVVMFYCLLYKSRVRLCLRNTAKTQSPVPMFDNITVLSNETSCMLIHAIAEASRKQKQLQHYLHDILFIKPGKDGITCDGGAVWRN